MIDDVSLTHVLQPSLSAVRLGDSYPGAKDTATNLFLRFKQDEFIFTFYKEE